MFKDDYILVDHITSIDVDVEKLLRVYPNPAINTIFIESPVIIEQITIVDLIGTDVLNTQHGDRSFSFDVSELNSGIYILSLKTKKGTYHKKIQVRQ